MVNHTNRGNFRFAWPDILWRLLLTVLLLLALAGFGLTIFDKVATHSNTQILPPLTQEVEGVGPR